MDTDVNPPPSDDYTMLTETGDTSTQHQSSESEFRDTVLHSLNRLTILVMQLNTKVDSFSLRMSAMEADLQSAKTKSDAQQKQLDDIRKKVGAIEGETAAHLEASQNLKKELTQAKLELTKLKKDLEVQHEISAQLQLKLTVSNDSHKQMQQKLEVKIDDRGVRRKAKCRDSWSS